MVAINQRPRCRCWASRSLPLLTGILFGVAPAWLTAQADAARRIARSPPALTSLRRWLDAKTLVVTQAALSLVLLCAAGLLIQSLRNVEKPLGVFGFETANRYILHIEPHMAGYAREIAGPLSTASRYLGGHSRSKPRRICQYSPMEGDN